MKQEVISSRRVAREALHQALAAWAFVLFLVLAASSARAEEAGVPALDGARAEKRRGDALPPAVLGTAPALRGTSVFQPWGAWYNNVVRLLH